MKKTLLIISILALFSSVGTDIIAQQKADDSRLVALNQSSFDKGISKGYVLVDFWAAWCRPCVLQKPILEEVAFEMREKLTIATVDTDKNSSLSQKFNIRGIPCMILFKDGKEVKRLVGLHQKDRLLSELNAIVK
jgi:thioredoxin 1